MLLNDNNRKGLTEEQLKVLGSLIAKASHNPPELEDIWRLMNDVWDEMGCNNEKPDWGKIREFYNHPVWILNGLFIEQHDLSMKHRHTISDWIIREKLTNVLDYGGGFGTLARLIAAKNASASIDVYEPHSSDYVILRTAGYPCIRYISSFDRTYDCLVSIDVTEHVTDPLKLLSEQIDLVRQGGYLLIANNFWPVIKCHLPVTFHLRYTFNMFVKLMGLELIGFCEGSHAILYRKQKTIHFDWRKIRRYEQISKFLFHVLNPLHMYYIKARKVLM
jgi:2-polyprenyl-6-hydroxyphenyl methylase/3-demethylubiquinone-9 3-methyltransferase